MGPRVTVLLGISYKINVLLYQIFIYGSHCSVVSIISSIFYYVNASSTINHIPARTFRFKWLDGKYWWYLKHLEFSIILLKNIYLSLKVIKQLYKTWTCTEVLVKILWIMKVEEAGRIRAKVCTLFWKLYWFCIIQHLNPFVIFVGDIITYLPNSA